MAPDEYSKALDKALLDLQESVQQRDLLNADIAGLRETVRVLSTLVQVPSDKQRDIAKLLAMADYATPSLTDAIRSLLLRVSPKEMTAIEVRNELEDSSDTEGCSLSACHAALKRMLSDKEIESGPMRNGKATYRRVIHIARPNANDPVLRGILSGRIPLPRTHDELLQQAFQGPIPNPGVEDTSPKGLPAPLSKDHPLHKLKRTYGGGLDKK